MQQGLRKNSRENFCVRFFLFLKIEVFSRCSKINDQAVRKISILFYSLKVSDERQATEKVGCRAAGVDVRARHPQCGRGAV
jgi:hypothetical protein